MSLELTVGQEVRIVYPEDPDSEHVGLVEQIRKAKSAVVREALVFKGKDLEDIRLYGKGTSTRVFTRRAGGGWALKGCSEPYLTEKVEKQ